MDQFFCVGYSNVIFSDSLDKVEANCSFKGAFFFVEIRVAISFSYQRLNWNCVLPPVMVANELEDNFTDQVPTRHEITNESAL